MSAAPLPDASAAPDSCTAAGKQAQLRESVAVQPGSLLVFRDEAYTSSLHGIMEVGRAHACKAACWRRCSDVLVASLMPLHLLTLHAGHCHSAPYHHAPAAGSM